MRKVRTLIAAGQRGFTLIELIVVIAILGVLAAITVPVVTKYLSDSKSGAFTATQAKIQTAVEAYLSSPGNSRFVGKRQYPLIGRAQTSQSSLTVKTSSVTLVDDGDPFSDSGSSDDELWNPVGGTRGADLKSVWTDGASDATRTVDDGSDDTWTSVAVTRGGVTYYTDPRYFFIDFEELVSAGLLDAVPDAAAVDNTPDGGTAADHTGSYIWYVDQNGKVQALFTHLPSNAGFQAGVFP